MNEQPFLAIFVQVELKDLVLNQQGSPPTPHLSRACPGSLPATPFQGSNKVLLYHFSSASPLSCNGFTHTHGLPFLHLSAGFTTHNHLLFLLFSSLPCHPSSSPPDNHRVLPLPWDHHEKGSDHKQIPPAVAVLKVATMCGHLDALLPRNAKHLSLVFSVLTWLSVAPRSCEVMIPSHYFPTAFSQ